MMYYGQYGEDALLHRLFPNKKEGFFVEVGCIDGRRFSNTLFFEKQGWHGICVEAHNDYIPYLRKNRPKSLVFHCAIGEADKEHVTFYANSRGSLSSLDASYEDEYRERFGKFFTGFEEQTVPMRCLNSIFEESNISEIDILSLDIEGYEIKALEGLDFERYRPKVFVIEADSPAQEKGIDQLLIPNGYRKLLRIADNVFYTEDGAPGYGLLHNIRFDFLLKITGNALDNEDDEVVRATICTEAGLSKYVQKLRSVVLNRKVYFPKLYQSR